MIIAFTGAGISVASGIPTFSSQPEMWEKLTRDFANYHPEEYRELMREWVSTIRGKRPNDAHYALAEYGIPIITMNVDGLHQKAGSKNVIAVHGRLPEERELDYCDELAETPVLYGDVAPEYLRAFRLLDKLGEDDTLLIIGASRYTGFADWTRKRAEELGAKVVEIQDNAVVKVREFLEREIS